MARHPPSLDACREFYQQGGYIKRKESKRECDQRIQMALYGSSQWDRPEMAAEGGPIPFAGGGDTIRALMKRLANTHGKRAATRVEQAADSADLSRYSSGALDEIFDKRNPGLLTTLRPSEFENFAYPLPARWREEFPYKGSGAGLNNWQGDYYGYIKSLQNVAEGQGFDQTPALWLGADKVQGPTRDLRLVRAHDGRHRMRALEGLGDEPTLVNLLPEERGSLGRTTASRRITPSWVDRGSVFPQVMPQTYLPYERSTWLPQEFPNELFADGGRVGYAGGSTVRRMLKRFADPPASRIDDWKWRPLPEVAKELPTEIPPHVLQFGDYMDTIAGKAGREGLDTRDLLKGYGTTLSSIQRGAVNRDNLDLALSSPERMIRPEGAFADWMGSKAGQKWLQYASEGETHPEALADMAKRLGPFGLMPTLVERLSDAPGIVSGREGRISELVDRARRGASDPSEWREVAEPFKGIGPSKAGFLASLWGRGDIPTLDARQIVLHSGEPTKAAKPWLNRAGAGEQAVDRLAARQDALRMFMPPDYDPFRQHLTHHTVWDAVGNEATTHADVIDAMLNRAEGGPIPFKTGGPSWLKSLIKAKPKEVNLVERGAERTGRSTEEVIDALRQKNAAVKADMGITQEGISSLKGTEPIANAMARITEQRPELNWLTPEDVVGHVGVGGMGDRHAAGIALHGVNGVNFDVPIIGQGGPGYPYFHDPLWAMQGKGPVTGVVNAAREHDLPALFLTKQMGLQSLDQSPTMMSAMDQLLKGANIDPKDAEAFTESLRQRFKTVTNQKTGAKSPYFYLPDVPDFRSENFLPYLLDQNQADRSQLITAMDSKNWNKRGIPNPVGTRMALTDPGLYTSPTNTPGRTIGRIDLDNPYFTDPKLAHPAYDTGLRGDVMGGFGRVLPWESVFPDYAATVAGKTDAARNRAYMISNPTQVFDQKWLDQIMPVWAKAPKWAKGGRVFADEPSPTHQLYHTSMWQDDWMAP